MITVLRAVGVVALLGLASGCSPTSAEPWCGPSTCGGCCRGEICEGGVDNTACGVEGAACSDCSATGQQCSSAGVCQQAGVGGGAGGGAAGGGAGGGTGGGSGGGGGGGGGPTCAAPLLACGATCIDAQTDRDNCGACGNVCSGSSVCSAGQCATLPADCSTAPCPSVGYYCDLGSKQCKAGCVLDSQCAGKLNKCDTATRTCGCEANSCGANSSCTAQRTCACNTGSHACGAQCSSNTSLDSCGSSCVSCPAAPANGVRSCDGTQCGFTCNPGFLRTGQQCVACNTVQACGAACVQCAVPAFSTGQCTASGCDFTCNSGFRKVGNSCESCNTAAACGASCQACATSPDAIATCNLSTTCALACKGPFKCNGTCCAPTALTAGGFHTCAMTSNGGVRCWGDNNFSQIGVPESVPVAVTNVPGITNAVKLGTGGSTNCVELQTGQVKCWGRGDIGTLGNGSQMDSSTPVVVPGLAGFQEVKGGFWSMCAVTSQGGAKCWGANETGRLGNNSTNDSVTPVDVFGLTSGVSMISVSTDHACAVTTAGAAKCWGSNNRFQLGSQYQGYEDSPVAVVGLASGVKAIAAGDEHTCALMTTGAVKCWGSSSYGTVPGGAVLGQATPLDVPVLGTGNLDIVAGLRHTCVITATRGVKCWGDDGNGQLGDGAPYATTVVQVAGLTSGVMKLVAGYRHTCALMDTGAIKCWGESQYGQNGRPAGSADATAPVDIPNQP